MAERDQTLVSITLDRSRPYHIGDDERNVVWVGPGDVQVPRWVAEHWGHIPPNDAASVEDRIVEEKRLSNPIPPDAVSATIETVDEQPLKTVETVQTIVAPAVPKRSHSRKAG